MKAKLFVLTALSLAGAALSAAPASAGWLCHRCHHNNCSMTVICRPYNAFSPACSGSLVCDGCCPFSCNGVSGSPELGGPLLGLNGDPVAVNAFQMRPMMMQAPMMSMPAQQMPMHPQTQMPMTYPTVPAGYPQALTPVYYPLMPNTMPMNPYQQVPAYWYGN
jgi:hypothetical protein